MVSALRSAQTRKYFLEKVRKNSNKIYGALPLILQTYVDVKRADFAAFYVLSTIAFFLISYKVLSKIQEMETGDEDLDYDYDYEFP